MPSLQGLSSSCSLTSPSRPLKEPVHHEPEIVALNGMFMTLITIVDQILISYSCFSDNDWSHRRHRLCLDYRK